MDLRTLGRDGTGLAIGQALGNEFHRVVVIAGRDDVALQVAKDPLEIRPETPPSCSAVHRMAAACSFISRGFAYSGFAYDGASPVDVAEYVRGQAGRPADGDLAG